MRWVIGDIHGMFRPLEAMLEAVGKIDSHPLFCFVGDYVNRGPNSRQVIELLLHLNNARFVRGNHDDVLDLILHDQWFGGEADAFTPADAAHWFLKHGLVDTLLSYGMDRGELADLQSDDDDRALVLQIRQVIPSAHRQFIRNLPIYLSDADAFIAHAFWPPEEKNDPIYVEVRSRLDVEFRHRVLWERYHPNQITAAKAWSRPAFFGHTPVSNYPAPLTAGRNHPIRGPLITLLDTAIALGSEGLLSAVCIEDGRSLQIDRDCRVVL
jgi:serine/threonine protein phosphatase 1